ncbi:hypothetical protein PAXRUDRAFT_18650 [Paxillus rubicundulus Ve08.2h10]|uniref:Uncharacterized protein n=1 Tax=Paxillus rubicundulus Ve08.2h10 TaxID=930991 RepID=A0A0D0D6N0_9AGAM|nr:hypothetical protein PAXRUDRAFT_18650 [Paxillus rubicundulus Ve08.2h10]
MDSEWALQLRADPPGGGAEVRTPTFLKSGVTNSEVAGKRRYKLRHFGKADEIVHATPLLFLAV